MQERAGVRKRLATAGAHVIRDFMPEQHREFFHQLPFIVTGHVDADRYPCASILDGPPGFISSPTPKRLAIHALPAAGTPLHAALAPSMSVGLLGIEPHTRRRNRLNGIVAAVNRDGFEVAVRQSFGNCPKYIQAREPSFAPESHRGGAAVRAATLDAEARALVAAADTFFIASAHGHAAADDQRANGVDVSHRGGKPGFVRVDGPSALTVPDFIGNFFFNTLGNLAVNPRAGLLFAEFDGGDVLQVAADAEIAWDGPELAAFSGAQRLLKLRVRKVLRFPGSLGLRFGPAELSPHLAGTGHW